MIGAIAETKTELRRGAETRGIASSATKTRSLTKHVVEASLLNEMLVLKNHVKQQKHRALTPHAGNEERSCARATLIRAEATMNAFIADR